MKSRLEYSDGKWVERAALTIARSHSAVAVYNGRIYVFGGGGPGFQSLDSSAVYDPNTDSWTEIAPMPTRRSGTVTAVIDDRIYVMAGGFKHADGMFRFLSKVEIYDPATDLWQDGPSLIMPHDYPAVAELNGEIYVLGGHHPDAYRAGPKTDPGFDYCECLDPVKGTWRPLAPLSQPRFALAAVNFEDRILAMGGVAFTPEGFNNFTLIEQYDAAHNRWTSDEGFALPWPAAGLSTCTINEKLCIFGGYSGDGIHSRAAFYDPATGDWTLLPSMPAPRAATGIATVADTVYLIGGWADDGRTPQATMFSYDFGQ